MGKKMVSMNLPINLPPIGGGTGGGGGRTWDKPESTSPSSLPFGVPFSFEFPLTIVVKVGMTATPPVGAWNSLSPIQKTGINEHQKSPKRFSYL